MKVASPVREGGWENGSHRVLSLPDMDNPFSTILSGSINFFTKAGILGGGTAMLTGLGLVAGGTL